MGHGWAQVFQSLHFAWGRPSAPTRNLDCEFTVELRAWDIPALEAAVGGAPPCREGWGGGLRLPRGWGAGGLPGVQWGHVARHKPLGLRNVCETLIT